MTTNTLRPGLPPLPPKMRGLPIDKRGFPVPYFVALVNDEPDHRLVEPTRFRHCLKNGRCWICGESLGVFKAFTVGPMCAINRISSEPPAHFECALYSVQACPFLSRPHAHRREAGLPDALNAPAGNFITRNPGVTLIWVTRSFKPFKATLGRDGVLIDMGPPTMMEWFAEGRPATREEVDAAIASGLPTLLNMAREHDEPTREIDERVRDLREALDQQFAEEG